MKKTIHIFIRNESYKVMYMTSKNCAALFQINKLVIIHNWQKIDAEISSKKENLMLSSWLKIRGVKCALKYIFGTP